MSADPHLDAPARAALAAGVGAQALQLVADAVVVLDIDHRIVWFNTAAATIGKLSDAAIGTPWADHVPSSGDQEMDHVRSIGAGVAAQTFDSTRIGQFGMEVNVRVTVAPIEDAKGLAGIVIVAVDMSEHVLMQEAVVEMARRSAEIQSLGKVGLWVWDEASDNVQWSEELYRIHGLAPADFDGSLVDHLAPIAEVDRRQVGQALMEVRQSGQQRDIIYAIDTPPGTRWIRSSVRVAEDNGVVSGLVGTCQDVTRQQLYAEAILTANRELELVAGSLAHDLKTPLTVVVGVSDVLCSMMDDDDPRRELALKVVTSGKLAAEMINELVASAKQAALGRSLTPVALEEIIGRVRTQLQLQLEDVQATVVVRDLPIVHGVEALLRQLFFNLVGNAIKYRSPERALRLEIDGAMQGDQIEIRVIDNGRGVPERHRDAVFARGARVHQDVGIEGDGLGLATCAQIMEQHRGTIHVEDGQDGGSAFVCRFPTAGQDDEAPTIALGGLG